MGKLAWYKRDPSAAISGMMDLSLEERGAYNTVLDLIYDKADELQDDDRYIAWCCRCDIRVWRRIKKTLLGLEKLHVENGYIRNYRATSEVSRALATGIARREAALSKHRKSAANESKNKDLASANAHANAHANAPLRARETLRDSEVSKKDSKNHDSNESTPCGPSVDFDAQLYQAAEAFFGPKGRGMATKAKQAMGLAAAVQLFQTARTKVDPREFIVAGITRGPPKANGSHTAKGAAAAQPQFFDRIRELDAQFEPPERPL